MAVDGACAGWAGHWLSLGGCWDVVGCNREDAGSYNSFCLCVLWAASSL